MSHQGFDNTFSDFKHQFYSKIGDASCFNVLDINLLKVVLDGLKVQYTKRGKISHCFNYSLIRTLFYFIFKIILDHKKKTNFKKLISKNIYAKCIVGFSDRVIIEGNDEYPIYFQKLFNEFGRDNFCYITKHKKTNVKSDIDLSDLYFSFNVFSSYNIKLYKSIRKWLSTEKTKNTWTGEELKNIEIASFLFFTNYIKFDLLLKKKKFDSAFLICHYHNEAFILACKKNNVIVNELQHGLIANEDIFYVFPDQVSGIIHNALFPDNIFVYGDFWKTVLLNGCEYSANRIHKIGYYHYESLNTGAAGVPITDSKKVILVTTQYSAHNYFIEFVTGLSPKLGADWKIVVKLHPAEMVDDYKVLNSLINVEIASGNLDAWILRSEFIVTIFSTTIFDAIRLGKFAFSLNIDLYSDYVNNLTSIGAATLLGMNENPIDKLIQLNKKIDSNEFYDDFNKTLIKKIIN